MSGRFGRFNDHHGEKFGRLTALILADPPVRNKKTFWKFECECGATVEKPIAHVLSGYIKSCGCLRAEHYEGNKERGEECKVLNKKGVATLRRLKDQGKTNRAIAKELNISPGTVSNYLNKCPKCGSNNHKNHGSTKAGTTRFKCKDCGKTFTGTKRGRPLTNVVL